MLSALFSGELYEALILMFVSATPVVELRGAIPLGAAQGFPFWETFTVCVIGNMLPVPFIILFARKVLGWLKKTRTFQRPIVWLERRVLKKASKLRKYNLIELGLLIFVAIPLPGTGAWTGAILAALLDIRIQRALPAILLGVLIAGFIVGGMSYGFIQAISLFVPAV